MPKMTKTNIKILLPAIVLLFSYCKSPKSDLTYSSQNLKLIPVTENCYMHKSYLQLDDGSRVECNGLVYVNEGSAIIYDCPSNSENAATMINWLVNDNDLKIAGLVINHHHRDCIDGIEEFHKRGIKSYANSRTIAEIPEEIKRPQISFDEELSVEIGNNTVINRYFGAAHSNDNIVSYIPREEVLFGGCMIKSLNAKKGNLADANLAEWSNTVKKIKSAYPQLKVVIPGHGEFGDRSLLDYTINLFSQPTK